MNVKTQWTCCGSPPIKQAESPSTAISTPHPAVTSTDGQPGGWLQAVAQANWRLVWILTLAFTCIAFGFFVVIQGFDWLRHLWVVGPILIMCGLAIMVSAFIVGKKPVDNDILSEKYVSSTRPIDGEFEDADRAERQAVPMEPLVFLLH